MAVKLRAVFYQKLNKQINKGKAEAFPFYWRIQNEFKRTKKETTT